mmetsp:Transcript_19245/g.17065  ORF Transcript_19245/g.17065 Transcript_19245/m.17065 type:complete len:92 (+) Transcript_19245:9-284(+)
MSNKSKEIEIQTQLLEFDSELISRSLKRFMKKIYSSDPGEDFMINCEGIMSVKLLKEISSTIRNKNIVFQGITIWAATTKKRKLLIKLLKN